MPYKKIESLSPKQYKLFKPLIEKYKVEAKETKEIETQTEPELEIQENVLIMSMNDMRDQYLELERRYQELQRQTQRVNQAEETQQEFIRRVRNIIRI